MSKAAARRAARRGLPFAPPVANPELEAVYYAELEKSGIEGGFVYAPPEDFSVLFIDENPDRAWQELGAHFLCEVEEYNSWSEPGLQRPFEMSGVSVEALRAAGHYEIITPDECVARHKANAEFFATIHPLIGGMPLERGWQCLKLYAEQVLPALN